MDGDRDALRGGVDNHLRNTTMTPSQAGVDDLNPDAPWNQEDEVGLPCEDCQRETEIYASDYGYEETPWKVCKVTGVICAECEQKRLNQEP